MVDRTFAESRQGRHVQEALELLPSEYNRRDPAFCEGIRLLRQHALSLCAFRSEPVVVQVQP